jgi:hypothetical protein
MNYIKSFVLAVSYIFCTSTYAAPPIPFDLQKPVKCAKTEDVFEHFETTYGETVKWFAKDDWSDSYYAVLMNEDKTSWTILQFDTRVACVFGSGKQVKSTDL